MANNKSYNLFIKNLKSFSLTLTHFAAGVGFTVIIKSLFIRFSAVLSQAMNSFSNIKISLRILSVINLTTELSTSVIKISPKLITVIRLLTGLVSDIHITVPLLASASERDLIASNIATLFVKLNASPLLGQFITIGFYDASTLGSMDATTLGNLEFVAT